MARKSKKQVETQEADTEKMFPDIGDPSPEVAVQPEGDEFLPGYKTKDEATKAIEELKAEKARFDAELAAMRKTQDSTQTMLETLMAQRQQAAPEQNEDDAIDLTKLPDPIEDKAGFTTGVMGAVDKMVEKRLSRVSVAHNKQSQLDTVWNEFKEEHEDIAAHPEIAEAAVASVLKKAKARGVDPERYILAQKSRFFEDVVTDANQRIARLRKSFGVEDEQEEPTRDRGLSDSSRGRPTERRDGAGQLGSLIDDIKKAQRTSGYF